MRKYDWVAFDFNGTLYDDLDISVRIANRYFDQAGLPRTDREAYRRTFAFPAISYYRKAGLVREDADFEYYKTDFAKQYQALEEKRLAPHALEVLRDLKKAGYRLAIISILSQPILTGQCRRFGLSGCFDAIIGQDNVDSRSKRASAQAFFKANRIDPRRAIFIGDTLHDLETAQALGADCLLYSGGYQARDILAASGAPVIDDLGELFRYL